jgi:multiple sugar transport system substrate-binding protein
MVNYGEPQPSPASWEPFQDVVVEAIQKTLMGEDPQKALDTAVEKMKSQQLEPK